MTPLRKNLVITTILSLCCFSALGATVHYFGSGPIGASGTFVTTVTKTPYQVPASLYFASLSMSMTSSAESLLEQTVGTSSTSTPMIGATSGTLQLLYAYSTSLDGTLNIYNNTAGSGSAAASVSMLAGVPYEWDYLTSGVTAALNLTNTRSISFAAGTTVNGGTTTVSSTQLTAVGLYP